MSAAHTAVPWQVTHSDPTLVCDSDGEVRGCAPIATMHGTAAEKRANAALIVKCVNAHDELVQALESFLRAPTVGSSGTGSATIVVQEFNVRAARAAIAKATGAAS